MNTSGALFFQEDSPRRLPQLDGIRGIAIILVLIWHYVGSRIDPQASPMAGLIAGTLSITWSGVDLFFVLSGFLIGGILLDHRQAPNYFKTFYIRRICRIFPLYFAWFFLYVGITIGAPDLLSTTPLKQLFQNVLPLWSYPTFTQNFIMAQMGTMGSDWLGITWSLAVEEQFYLVLPLLVRLISPRRFPYVLVTMIVAAPIFRMLLIYLPPHSAFPNYVLMPSRADSLLSGVLIAYMIRKPDVVKFLIRHVKALYTILGILLAGAAILAVVSPSMKHLIMNMYGYSWLAALYACLILLAMIEKEGVIYRLTRAPALCNMGIFAYGIYIFHQSVNALAHALVLDQTPQLRIGIDVLVSLCALFVTIFIARISWNYFEKQIVAIGHRFQYTSTHATVQASRVLAE